MTRWSYPAAVLLSSFVLSGCNERQEPRPIDGPSETVATPVPPLVQLPAPPLDREQLLLAVSHIASATSLGLHDEKRQRGLDGGKFQLRLRFGCVGDGGEQAGQWTFDEKRRVLSLRVEPGITRSTALPGDIGVGYETVEGFWIHRPWMLQAGCSPAGEPTSSTPANDKAQPATADTKLPAPSPRIGIAQFFSDTEARTHRRDNRDYTSTKVLAEGVLPSRIGYDLVINGRLKRQPSGEVVLCAGSGATTPPDCIISAEFDSVTIEEPTSGETIATWSNA